MRLSVLACLCGLVAGCTYTDDETVGGSPSAIRDAYLIAHGMAESYQEQPHADPEVLAQLARLDAQAAAAVRDMEGSGSSETSARAVAALTEYAARETSLER